MGGMSAINPGSLLAADDSMFKAVYGRWSQAKRNRIPKAVRAQCEERYAILTGKAPVSQVKAIAYDIEREHQAAYGKAREALEHARRAGELLLQAKAAIGHGAFGKWLTEHISFAERTAQAYMRIASNWPAIEAKSATVAEMTVRGALAAVKNTTRPAAAVTEPVHEPVEHGVHDVQRAVQIQLLACMLDAWDEATDDCRLEFLRTIHGRGELMPVVNRSAKAA
jgi:hypothetical protein